MRGRGRLGAIAALVLLASAAPSVADSVPDAAWPPVGILSQYRPGYGIVTSDDPGFNYFSVVRRNPAATICKEGITDPFCVAQTTSTWQIYRVLPVCSNTTAEDDCVEALSISRGTESKASALLRNIDDYAFPAAPEQGLPAGSTPGLWSDPFSTDANVGYYVRVGGYLVNTASRWMLFDFQASVVKYRAEPTTATGPGVIPRQPTWGGQGPWFRSDPGMGIGCIWIDKGQCGRAITIDADERPRLTMHLNSRVTGWLTGRMVDPSIELTPISSALNRLVVEANPAPLAMVAVGVAKADATKEIADLFRGYQYGNGGTTQFSCGTTTTEGDCGVHLWSSSSSELPKLLTMFSPYAKSTASKLISTWSVRTGARTSGRCLSDTTRLVGLVTTNATYYQSSPPSFDGTTLNYSVAAMHYAPDGTPFAGTYDLVMRSDAARCLYGFGNVPMFATVSVEDEGGTQSVATTVLSDRDGWMHLAAYNFHFSSPTIKVALTRIPQAEPTPTPTAIPSETATPSPSPTVQSTPTPTARPTPKLQIITCVKGKQTKKLTVRVVKCPTGWKVKK